MNERQFSQPFPIILSEELKQSEDDFRWKSFRQERKKSLPLSECIERKKNVRYTIKDIELLFRTSNTSLILCGSAVYGRHAAYIEDIDLIAVLDNENFTLEKMRLIRSKLGLEQNTMPISSEDIADINANKINSLGYTFSVNGIETNIKFMTDVSLKQCISLSKYTPRKNRKPIEDVDLQNPVPCKVTSFTGQSMYIHQPYFKMEKDNSFVDITVPGVLYIPSLERITIPYIVDTLMTSKVISQNTQCNINQIINSVWSFAIRIMLFQNNLLDNSALPVAAAYNVNYVKDFFVCKEDFSQEFIRTLEERYFRELNKIITYDNSHVRRKTKN